MLTVPAPSVQRLLRATGDGAHLVQRTPVALVPNDDLETALRPCKMNHEEHMPVVDNGQDLRVIGKVRYQDLVLAYNRALLAARAAERGQS